MHVDGSLGKTQFFQNDSRARFDCSLYLSLSPSPQMIVVDSQKNQRQVQVPSFLFDQYLVNHAHTHMLTLPFTVCLYVCDLTLNNDDNDDKLMSLQSIRPKQLTTNTIN